jgi:hypothetical protein
MVKTSTKRWMGGIAGGVTLLIAAIGFLHTPAGRPLLARVGGCPVGNAPPARVEEGRVRAVLQTRGAEAAPARPALGFRLDETTLADVKAWASHHGARCVEKREGTLLQCADVPSRAIDGPAADASAKVDDVSFGFTPGTHVLTGISTLRYARVPGGAVATLDHKVSSLEKELGAGKATGQRDEGYLSGGAYRTAVVEYRFRDYMADVTGMNLPGRGIAVREHYQSARVD